MVTDVSTFPEYKFEKGNIFLYSLAFDQDSGEELDELEIINEDDLLLAQGYYRSSVYIGNSHLTYSSANRAYRLYVTEVDSGLFVVDFTYTVGQRELTILKTSFIDLKALLEKNNLHLPNDGSFQAVTKLNSRYHPRFDQEGILVTTKNYDNFEVILSFDDKGNLLSSTLDKIYQRYAFYQTTNQVKAVSGYVAISYLLPPVYQYETNYTRQLVAVYDTSETFPSSNGVEVRYMIGAFTHNKTQTNMFAFNTTYDVHSNGTRVGLVVTFPYEVTNQNMYEMSISSNLSVLL